MSYEMQFICLFYSLLLVAYTIAYTKYKVVKYYNKELYSYFDEAAALIDYR